MPSPQFIFPEVVCSLNCLEDRLDPGNDLIDRFLIRDCPAFTEASICNSDNGFHKLKPVDLRCILAVQFELAVLALRVLELYRNMLACKFIIGDASINH